MRMRVLAVSMVLLAAGCSSGGSSDGAELPGRRPPRPQPTPRPPWRSRSRSTTRRRPPRSTGSRSRATPSGSPASKTTRSSRSTGRPAPSSTVRHRRRRSRRRGRGPDGSVWSTGFATATSAASPTASTRSFTTIKAGINPLEFDADGILYIGTYGPNGELFQIDPTDEKAFTRSLGGGLPDINGFGILADGTIVAPSGGIAGTGFGRQHHGDPVDEDETGDKTIETIVDGLPGRGRGCHRCRRQPVHPGQRHRRGLSPSTWRPGPSEVVQTVEQGAPFDNMSFADGRDALPLELHRPHHHRSRPRRHRAPHQHRRLTRHDRLRPRALDRRHRRSGRSTDRGVPRAARPRAAPAPGGPRRRPGRDLHRRGRPRRRAGPPRRLPAAVGTGRRHPHAPPPRRHRAGRAGLRRRPGGRADASPAWPCTAGCIASLDRGPDRDPAEVLAGATRAGRARERQQPHQPRASSPGAPWASAPTPCSSTPRAATRSTAGPRGSPWARCSPSPGPARRGSPTASTRSIDAGFSLARPDPGPRRRTHR